MRFIIIGVRMLNCVIAPAATAGASVQVCVCMCLLIGTSECVCVCVCCVCVYSQACSLFRLLKLDACSRRVST